MKNIEVKNILAKDLVYLFNLFDTEEEEKRFLEEAELEGFLYTLSIDEYGSTISEIKNSSSTDIFFDVYTKDVTLEELESIGEIEKLD